MSLDYAGVLDRLSEIDVDLGNRQNAYEEAAEDYYRLIRDFEKRMAQTKALSKAKTETAKKDEALIAIAAADDNLYEDLTTAQSKYEAQRAALRVLEARLSIGQSLLKAMQREAPQTGAQPQWSRAA